MSNPPPPSVPRVTWARRIERAVLAGGHELLRWALRIALPLVSATALLRAFPYHTTIGGVPFRVQATLFTQRGFSADTTVGSWVFPRVTALPVGVHLTPENVDVLRLSRIANPNVTLFVDRMKSDFADQLPFIAAWLIGTLLIGLGIGLAMAAAINMAIGYLRGHSRRRDELRLRLRQLTTAVVITVLVAAFGVATFNRDWTKQSRLTGTLGAAQLFPSELSSFYNRQSKVYDVLGSVVGIQSALQDKINQQNTPDTAYNIMFISDIHLAAVYPLVLQYAKSFDIKLIINTGDESEFGTAAELTPTFRTQLAAVTKTVPMLWLAGNHDSPEVIEVLRNIEGVTVLGGKTKQADGSYAVTGSWVRALGLTVGGLPDPRVYGASGVYGSDVDADTDKLQRQAVDGATKDVSSRSRFDIMASHEPAATTELLKKLSGQIRQVAAGHTHRQNKTSEIQTGSTINLVEGSTGAGGLDNINRGVDPPPIEFSIESVSASCQFTRLLRFQLADPAAPTSADVGSVRDDVSVSTVYLKPQPVAADRKCAATDGVSNTVGFDILTEPNG